MTTLGIPGLSQCPVTGFHHLSHCHGLLAPVLLLTGFRVGRDLIWPTNETGGKACWGACRLTSLEDAECVGGRQDTHLVLGSPLEKDDCGWVEDEAETQRWQHGKLATPIYS